LFNKGFKVTIEGTAAKAAGYEYAIGGGSHHDEGNGYVNVESPYEGI